MKRIINEPTAAALSYGLHSKNENKDAGKKNVVIFDLGGGTFDVSVLAMDSGVFEVKATGGDTHLGGEDFDNAVLKWCMEQIKSKVDAKVYKQLEDSARAKSRLRRAVENAKRVLSSSMSAEIEVDSLIGDFDFNVSLDRAKFEALNADLFKRCIDTVLEVMQDASCKIEDVSDIVLVGGSTRIPCLQKSLYDMFNGRIELCKTVHPDEAVAHGAAVQGHILATGGSGGGKDLAGAEAMTDLLLLDVTPLSLGIELEGKQMSTLIKRNTPIPCKKTRTYSTVDDWQTVSCFICLSFTLVSRSYTYMNSVPYLFISHSLRKLMLLYTKENVLMLTQTTSWAPLSSLEFSVPVQASLKLMSHSPLMLMVF